MPVNDNGIFEPDWSVLADDRTRREQEVPWLNQMIEGAAASGLTAKTLEEMAEWRGYREALIAVRDLPQQNVAAIEKAALEAERQKEERDKNAGRARFGFHWLRRAPNPE